MPLLDLSRLKTDTCPSYLETAPKTKGFFKIEHASLIKYLAGKLSVASITRSYFEIIANALD